MTDKFETCFRHMPLVAILRGVRPEEAVAIGEALYTAGICIIEVPLNSPEPLASIKNLSLALGDRCVIGAGTVLTVDDVLGVAAAGGEIAVSPNTDVAVIECSLAMGITPMPGWGTVSEALVGYRAGARYLKLFPAITYGPQHVASARAVLPPDCKIVAVGGIDANSVDDWLGAGVDGLGIGSDIYPMDGDVERVHRAALTFTRALRLRNK